MERVIHPLEPVYDAQSRILILGTMASVASRKAGFYYMHPQNRFWPVLAETFGEPIPKTVAERCSFALAHRIALWDVVASCEIRGSSDSSIQNPLPNDVAGLLKKTSVQAVFTTGRTAHTLYTKLLEKDTGLPAILLPSPSPANCAVHFDALVSAYHAALSGFFPALCEQFMAHSPE